MFLRSLATALLGALLIATAPLAQTAPPADWHLLDAEADGLPGISLAQAYALLGDRTATPVVVAIIDSGVDIAHPDLAPVLWTNADEIAGNGLDDDGNGYADDLHGWSFLGGPGGNVEHERLELARFVAACRAGQAPEGYVCEDLETELEERRQEMTEQAAQMGPIFSMVREADALLRERLGDAYTPNDPASIDAGEDPALQRAAQIIAFVAAQGATPSDLGDFETYLTTQLSYNLNPDFDPRGMVGDDPDNADERLYGVADVTGPDAGHGTGVAGLVAAARGNGLGIDGVAPAQIMALRAVPDGDERDKDIANAIRYAVDNGARIINMSFGKDISPRRDVVEAAASYAAERGVLLVHAAGNDGADIEEADNFPTPVTLAGSRISTWLEVGASAADPDNLAAGFSNYGQTIVDLFAPGARVTSLDHGGDIQVADGTSFAAPVVAGVAALVMAYFPDLTAAEVRQILLDAATPHGDTETALPGSEDERVSFGTLSATGGIVNAAEAVRLAIERTQ